VGPETVRRNADGVLEVGGVALTVLAARYGTPLYVLDTDTLSRRLAEWRAALGEHGDIFYAGKAFLCRAMAEWARDQGVGVDVVSGGELYTALAAGLDAGRVIMHGNAKTAEEIAFAIRSGVGRLVVDSRFEIPLLADAAAALGKRQAVWLRVTPDVAVDTHAFIQTGHHLSKFGLGLADGAAGEAVRDVLARPSLNLTGYHMHIGSQITEVAPYEEAAARLMDWARTILRETGYWPESVDCGGGLGVAYRPGDPEPDPRELVERVRSVVEAGTPSDQTVPRLAFEPGRSVVAPAGLTLYRVEGIKRIGGGPTFVMIDGGMGDNIRPALYQAEYTALVVERPRAERERVSLAGRYCETGDIVIQDADLPRLERGDLVAVLTTGAYNYAMASNYNRVPRPAVVAVGGGEHAVWVERETWADVMRYDRPLAPGPLRVSQAGGC
jgi:diaminopimelate decarboxylase